MEYKITTFEKQYIPSAMKLFLKNYKNEREFCSLLPNKTIQNSQNIYGALEFFSRKKGVAVFSKGKLIAYMINGPVFDFKGQKAVLIPEFGHSAIEKDKDKLYRIMYMNLSSQWIKNRIHLNIIGHFTHDNQLRDTIYQLGFGAILAERIRELNQIKRKNNFQITEENNPKNLVKIQLEHNKYYPEAPIFIKKETDKKQILSELHNHKKCGDTFLTCSRNKEIIGYFIIGAINPEQGNEGFLLRDTKTAQIKSAYVKPNYRKGGIGENLLNESIRLAKQKGYKRLFVEHETANYYGGNFWKKFFDPYLYFSMRYIDNTLGKK